MMAIDLFCGLGGWTDGLMAEGYECIGFDIEAHAYDGERYPGQLVVQNVLTLHGSQFKDAALIVASPPCQKYSWMAMPFSRGRAEAARIRADDTGAALDELNRLFNACFRIQREASDAAGRHIPMVVENVRGAEPWVGRARWNFGSYYLWGDVPALMPYGRAIKVPSFRFDRAGSFQSASVRRTQPGNGARFTPTDCGVDRGNLSRIGFNVAAARSLGDDFSSKGYVRTEEDKRQHIGARRKAASAKIAKIPFALSSWIGRTYKPEASAA